MKKRRKSFSTELVNETFKIVKRHKITKAAEEKMKQEELEKMKLLNLKNMQEKEFSRKVSKGINDLRNKIIYLEGKIEEKLTIKISGNDPEKVKMSQKSIDLEILKMRKAIAKCEEKIELFSKATWTFQPPKVYSKNESNTITLMCNNCDKEFTTFTSYYREDSIRFSMCPACRKKVERALKDEEKLRKEQWKKNKNKKVVSRAIKSKIKTDKATEALQKKFKEMQQQKKNE